MGIFNRIKDPVTGTARVVSAAHPHRPGKWETCRLNVVIEAPEMAATAVEKKVNAPGNKRPWPGMVRPVTVERGKPEKFKVNWDQVPEHRDQAQQQAQALADSINQNPNQASNPTAPGNITVTSETHLVTGDQAEQIVKSVEQALGQDLDGDGKIG